jgi:two-component system, OmpR family, response regulator VicR
MARILIIDDDEVSIKVTRLRLTSAGFDATAHHGPFGSLNAIRKGEYDLILLDIRMPGLDGPSLIRLIRSTPGLERTKILLYSSMDHEILENLVLYYRVHGYISKTCSANALIGKVSEILRAP